VVERTNGWINHCRRLDRHDEITPNAHEGFPHPQPNRPVIPTTLPHSVVRHNLAAQPGCRARLYRACQPVRQQLGEPRRVLGCPAFGEKCCAVEQFGGLSDLGELLGIVPAVFVRLP
jgi:hypothetical protein